jgi:hypothetical protein
MERGRERMERGRKGCKMYCSTTNSIIEIHFNQSHQMKSILYCTALHCTELLT